MNQTMEIVVTREMRTSLLLVSPHPRKAIYPRESRDNMEVFRGGEDENESGREG